MDLKKIVLIVLTPLLIQFCCTKKGCIGDFLPSIIIKLNNVPATETRIVVYNYIDNSLKDSTVYFRSNVIELMPFTDYGNIGEAHKKYVIKVKNTTTTIDNINCIFYEEKIKCNKCFFIIPKKENVWRHSDFSYNANNQKYNERDTLFVNL